MAGTCLTEVRYAGFGDRAVAFIADVIIVSTLFFFLLGGAVSAGSVIGARLFSGISLAFSEPGMPAIIGSTVAAGGLFFLMCRLYSAGTVSSSYGGTLGKMIMGLNVTDFAGNRLSFWHATIRFIAKIFSGLILFIGFFMIRYSETKQGLHDRFAGTYVVSAKKSSAGTTGESPDLVMSCTGTEEKRE